MDSQDLGKIIIVTGCPGTGKTTIVRQLAQKDTRGVLLDVDTFHASVQHYVDPTTPESQQQNETINRATAQAAEGFARGGYTVFVDGIIGPWFIDDFLAAIGSEIPCAYVILQAELEETVRRASTRPDADKFPIDGVRHMHKSFSQAHAYTGHIISSDGLTEEQTLAKIETALSGDALLVSSKTGEAP